MKNIFKTLRALSKVIMKKIVPRYIIKLQKLKGKSCKQTEKNNTLHTEQTKNNHSLLVGNLASQKIMEHL